LDSLNNLELHKAIKQMRASRKLTQVKVAEAIGVSTFTLIRWERGERAPDGKFLQKLAATLGYAIVLNTDGLWSCYSIDDVFEGSSQNTSFQPESVDAIYKKAIEAKDKAVWNVFFKRLLQDNAELEAWFRKSDGGKDIDEKTFKVMSDVLLAMVRADK
jgi:transcriptional regulator with XRE-family HTH domain